MKHAIIEFIRNSDIETGVKVLEEKIKRMEKVVSMLERKLFESN